MQIHNYYSDVLLSIRTLFDSIIFKPDFIKYYSFNIANRTFEVSQRDYKPNRELPAAVITLQTERYTFGERPTNILQSPMENINQIPVLRDPETERTIFVQEEFVTVPIIVNVNCESQLQAKEVEFYIKRFLPLTKYIQLYSFTSFLEIDPTILFKLDMDFTKRHITNLFTRLNKNLGQPEHCFSMSYRPLVQLTSIDANIATPEQSTYSVNMSLDINIQCPLYLLYDFPVKTIERINVDFTRFGNEPISENSMRSFISHNEELRLTEPKKMVRRNLLIHELSDFNLMDLEVKGVNYKLFEIQFDPNDFLIKDNMEFVFFDIYNRFHRIEPTLIDKDINTVKFQIEEKEFGKFNATITNPIILQFVELL